VCSRARATISSLVMLPGAVLIPMSTCCRAAPGRHYSTLAQRQDAVGSAGGPAGGPTTRR
jgi:hypothetical protein